MYAIVMNVVAPPNNSMRTVEPRARTLKNRSIMPDHYQKSPRLTTAKIGDALLTKNRANKHVAVHRPECASGTTLLVETLNVIR
jgi:hypothetical protein